MYNICMYCKMITTVSLINITIISISYCFVCVVKNLEIHFIAEYTLWLPVVTRLYIRSLGFIYKFVPFDHYFSFLSSPQPIFYTLSL